MRVVGVADDRRERPVDVEKGLLVGLPAVGGVLVGTWLQQRMPVRTLSLLFAGVLVITAIRLLVGG